MSSDSPSILTSAAQDALWRAWLQEPQPAMRERLVESYLPYARMMAARLYARRHSQEFEFDDYLQFATVGLIEAVDRYRPGEGALFTTFAAKRICGAVLDGVEHLSERQQQISNRQRILSERDASLGTPDRTGSIDQVFEQLAGVAIGLALGYILDDATLYGGDEPQQAETQYGSIELKQLRERLLALVESLPERERLLIKYNYFNHVPFEALAELWGVSRSRIAQIHRSALDHLRVASREIKHYDVAW